jgi:hypothetical protein
MNRPASGLPWDEVKRRIRSRYDRWIDNRARSTTGCRWGI